MKVGVDVDGYNLYYGGRKPLARALTKRERSGARGVAQSGPLALAATAALFAALPPLFNGGGSAHRGAAVTYVVHHLAIAVCYVQAIAHPVHRGPGFSLPLAQ